MFFLNDFLKVDELRAAIDDYWVFYNGGRRHQSLDFITLNMEYFSSKKASKLKSRQLENTRKIITRIVLT